jgi:hypothetical protein
MIADNQVAVAYLENALRITVYKLMTFTFKLGLKVLEIQRKKWFLKEEIQCEVTL